MDNEFFLRRSSFFRLICMQWYIYIYIYERLNNKTLPHISKSAHSDIFSSTTHTQRHTGYMAIRKTFSRERAPRYSPRSPAFRSSSVTSSASQQHCQSLSCRLRACLKISWVVKIPRSSSNILHPPTTSHLFIVCARSRKHTSSCFAVSVLATGLQCVCVYNRHIVDTTAIQDYLYIPRTYTHKHTMSEPLLF